MYEVTLDVPTIRGLVLCERIKVRTAVDVKNVRAFAAEAGWKVISVDKFVADDFQTAVRALVANLRAAKMEPVLGKKPEAA